jgi:hypothetical protein
MIAAVRRRMVLALVILASACADSLTPTAPTRPIGTTSSQPAPPAPSPAPEFPAGPRPARTYLFAGELSYPVHEWTRSSRYVLYEDGTFALQYLQSAGSFEYRGIYTEADTQVVFRFYDNQNVSAPWGGATGTLLDDLLTVRYDLIMSLDDFEDAAYSRTR